MAVPSDEERRFRAEIRDPELVFRRYFDQIYRYCRQRVRSDADAEDICAQVFAEAIAALPRLRWKGRPAVSFLYTVAGRRVVDHRRHSSRATVDLDAVSEPVAPGPPVEVLAQHGALGRAIEALPEDQRLCVFLQVVQGHSFAEVASIVGRTEKACKGLVYRGLERLRATLKEQGVTPE